MKKTFLTEKAKMISHRVHRERQEMLKKEKPERWSFLLGRFCAKKKRPWISSACRAEAMRREIALCELPATGGAG